MTPSTTVLPASHSANRGRTAVTRPSHLNAYEFVVVAALRAQQLQAGCVPRLDGQHNVATMAQMEVAGGRVARADTVETPPLPRQCGWQL
jgi:DNA-directed RNA polymerase subunit K/omega